MVCLSNHVCYDIFAVLGALIQEAPFFQTAKTPYQAGAISGRAAK
jgi:hypothetical protein